jgi:hypothetical protein
MAYVISNNHEGFVYVLAVIAVAFLAFVGAAMWRQGARIERAISIMSEVMAGITGLPSAAGVPAPAKSATTAAPPTAAQPSPLPDVARVERRAAGGTPDVDPVPSRTTPPGDGDFDPDSIPDPYAAVDASTGTGDPLAILRAVESELSALGALAEAATPGHGAEFLDVPGALGPTLSLAARRIGVAVDLLELRPSPPSDPAPSEP